MRLFSVFSLLAFAQAASFNSLNTELVRRQSPTSIDGNCGLNSEVKATCRTSTFGNCCSEKGFCGKTSAYCGAGCQTAFGTCDDSRKQVVSTSGSCGATGTSNVTCQGSEFGNCCSQRGYCGKTSDYCGEGCNSLFGTCGGGGSGSGSATVSSTPSPTATPSPSGGKPGGVVSVDGNCGKNSGVLATCLGSEFGDCCSSLGYCGGNSSYCATGCQDDFGSCFSLSPLPSSVSSPSSNGTSNGTAPATSTAPPSTDLSAGAKAGISIGVIAVAAVIGFLAWYVVRRRKRRNEVIELGGNADGPEKSLPMEEAKQSSPSPAYTDVDTQKYGAAYEMGLGGKEGTYVTRYEMDGSVAATELDSMSAKERMKELEEARKMRVDERAAAGYDGAYRGN